VNKDQAFPKEIIQEDTNGTKNKTKQNKNNKSK
jgi:hypothetical protein